VSSADPNLPGFKTISDKASLHGARLFCDRTGGGTLTRHVQRGRSIREKVADRSRGGESDERSQGKCGGRSSYAEAQEAA
jgi:hypothetical protein